MTGTVTPLTAIATVTPMIAPLWPGVIVGLVTSSGSRFRIVTATGSIADSIYGRRQEFAEVNGTNKLLVFQINSVNNSTRTADIVDVSTAAGWMFGLFSANGAGARWNISGRLDSNGISTRLQVINPANTSFRQSTTGGTFDPSRIVAFEVYHRRGSDIDGSSELIFTPPYLFEALTLTGGTLASPASWNDYSDYSEGLTLRNNLVQRFSSGFYGASVPLSVETAHFAIDGAAIEFTPRANYASLDLRILTDPGDIGVRVNLPANGVAIFTAGQIKSDEDSDISYSSSVAVGGSKTTNGQLVKRLNSATLGARQTYNRGSFQNGQTITIAGAELDGLRLQSLTANPSIVINSFGTLATFSVADLAGNIRVNLAPGSYPHWITVLPNDTVIEMGSGGAGAYDFSGLTGGTLANPIVFDSVSAGAKTITLGSGIVAVAADPVTAGSITLVSITLVAPQVSYNNTSAADDSRICLKHSQLFSIVSANINTTTDAITLGTDSNSDAPAFATSAPYSIAFRIELAAGATMPTTTPQIIDGGSYRVTISSGAIQLFLTEADISGSPINFINAGANNGSGALLSLRIQTVAANVVVAGGAGASIPLTLPNGARVRRQAIHYDESGVRTVTSVIFDDILIWSSASGINDAAQISNVLSPWAIINNIAAATVLTLNETVFNNANTEFNSLVPQVKGSLAASASGITGIALEGIGRVQVNADDSDGIIWGADLLHSLPYFYHTESGILVLSGDTLTILSAASAVATNLEVENLSVSQLQIVGTKISNIKGIGLIAFNVASESVAITVAGGEGGSAPTAAAIRAEIEGSGSRLAAIQVKTDQLVFTVANQVDANALTGGGGGDATLANQTALITALGVVDGIVDDILIDTAVIGVAGAGLTGAGGTGNQFTAITTAITNATTGLSTLTATQVDALLLVIKGAGFDPSRHTLERIYIDALKRLVV